MFWIIFWILVTSWSIGVLTATTLAGYIHLLLVLALAMILIRVLRGGRLPV